MSDVSARLIVGNYYSEFPEDMREELDNELNTIGGLAYASPWYDAERIEWFVGYQIISNTSIDVIDIKEGLIYFTDHIQAAAAAFTEKYGLPAMLKCCIDEY